MLVTTSWISKNYNKFNKLYFDGNLPDISFKISRSKHNWGLAEYEIDLIHDTIIPLSITISNYYDSPEDVKIQTLLHEMIHIKDYFYHPEHFVRNGKKVKKYYYDAHGQWFLNECQRITKESGYKVAQHVTNDEINRSCLSNNSLKLVRNKKNIARLVVASSGINSWMFKTDEYKINNVISLIKKYIPEYNKISIYSFNNDALASRRSCNTKLSGWRYQKGGLLNALENYRATTIKTFYI